MLQGTRTLRERPYPMARRSREAGISGSRKVLQADIKM
jgi:hypothetical protein